MQVLARQNCNGNATLSRSHIALASGGLATQNYNGVNAKTIVAKQSKGSAKHRRGRQYRFRVN